jgi:glycosyltransferase involved in cell wall biosynthesis
VKLKLLTDQHFPYGINFFSDAHFETSQCPDYKHFPSAVSGILHVLHLYIASFRADIVLGNRRTVLMLGLLFLLYKPRRVRLVGYEMIFNFRDNLRHRLSLRLWRSIISQVDRMITQTQGEIDDLVVKMQTSADKFTFIPFYTENRAYEGPSPNGYVFAAGRMERDFVTLLKSLKDSQIPLVIVAPASQKEVLEKYRTASTRMYYDIAKSEYLDLLKKSRLVVISLRKGIASRGQVVLLEAMSMGKTAICSRVSGIKEYVREGETAVMVAPESPEDLREQIDYYFTHEDKLLQIGKTAFEHQRKVYTPAVFYANYQKALLSVKSTVTLAERNALAR